MDRIITALRTELIKNGDEKTKASGRTFFREEVELYGIKTALVTRIGKEYFALIGDREKEEVFVLCEELWKTGFMEESFIACNWSYYIRKKYARSDFKVFERWIGSYVNNWAACDTFCNHTVGAFIEMYPEYVQELKRFTKSRNRWMRRAAAVSLIVPAKKGLFLDDVLEIARMLLTDSDDLVRKGYGWMLKAASEPHEREVFDFVMSSRKNMPRTALRYAIEKMPRDLKSRAMEKDLTL